MPSVAMSRAVVCCASFGRPWALRKMVFFMPSCRALAVIMRAKPASEPPSSSASAVAESLADFVTSERIAVSTVIEPPALTPSLVGGSAAAFLEKRTLLDVFSLPLSSASKVR